MLANLDNAQILLIGLGAQLACAIGILVAARWRALFGFVALLPVFWGVPFMLASAHCLSCLDGVVVLPLGFLAVVCVLRVRALDQQRRESRSKEGVL